MKKNILQLCLVLVLGVLILVASISMILKRGSDTASGDDTSRADLTTDTQYNSTLIIPPETTAIPVETVPTTEATPETTATPDTTAIPTTTPAPETTPVTEPITTPVTEPITTPVTEPITTPVTEPITTPVTEPITTPVTEPITTPVTEPITTPVTEPITTPVTEPITTPVTEPITTPITTPVTEPITTPVTTPETTAPSTEDGVSQEGSALEEILKPAQITLLRPVASGILEKSNSSAIIDYSHTEDGYIMVKFIGATSARLKVQITGPTTTYTYNISAQEWVVFPLSDGNGDYKLKILKNVVDTRYSTVLSLSFSVSLKDEFAPFLRPNQYVNYENAVNSMNKAAELVSGKKTLLEKVEAIYSYVIDNIAYDYDKAATVESDYLPVLDDVLASGKGICFDYASLMAGMLRSQNIACKLVVGYADGAYHAWINVWSPDEGWINGSIFFDGVDWKLMDPTFAAGGSEPAGVQYTSKYIY